MDMMKRGGHKISALEIEATLLTVRLLLFSSHTHQAMPCNRMTIESDSSLFPPMCGIHSQHPGVVEAAVFGEPDEVYGERVVAVVVGRRGVKGEEVREWMTQHVPSYQVRRRNGGRGMVMDVLHDYFQGARRYFCLWFMSRCKTFEMLVKISHFGCTPIIV